MMDEDKMGHKGEELRGKVKKAAGRATGDKELRRQGQTDESKGNLKQAVDKVKDAFRRRR